MKKEVMASQDSKNVRIGKGNGIEEFLVGFVKIFAEKTAVMLRSTASVAYPPQAKFLNDSVKKWK